MITKKKRPKGVHIHISADAHRRYKVAAAKRGTTIRAVIEEQSKKV